MGGGESLWLLEFLNLGEKLIFLSYAVWPGRKTDLDDL